MCRAGKPTPNRYRAVLFANAAQETQASVQVTSSAQQNSRCPAKQPHLAHGRVTLLLLQLCQQCCVAGVAVVQGREGGEQGPQLTVCQRGHCGHLRALCAGLGAQAAVTQIRDEDTRKLLGVGQRWRMRAGAVSAWTAAQQDTVQRDTNGKKGLQLVLSASS